ncbi:(E2-independent) E3 ubiquitin-conjugating enzyme FATS [Stigmatopora nigra]
MTLRRPAAHLPMGWRRSGDESHWETQSSKGESFLSVNWRAPRPRSAIEGRQLDGWLGQLHRMQGDSHQAPIFCDQEPSNRRPYRTPSFSGVSSSCGSMKGSLTGSRESLQSEFIAQRRGSLERVHISQTPKKEQSQRSYVVPVKTGWLPIQRVMKVEDSQGHRQIVSPHSAAQVKLKQPITPTFLKSRGSVSLYKDDQAEKSQRKTWQTPDRSSPVIKQVADNETQKPGIWQAIRRGWNINRLSGTRSSQRSTVIPSEPRLEVPANRKVSDKEPQHSPLRTAVYGRPESVQRVFCGASDPHREETRVEERPLRSPAPPPFEPYRRHSLQPSEIQTSSTTTTLVPRNKVGFSSITISSRKVGRSASLNTSDRTSGQTANSLNVEAMGPRKATIVKVTEQRTTVKPMPVVHQRKPAIIKVTEHKESYSPGTGYTMGNISPCGNETEPVKSCEPAPSEVLEQEPKRPVIRKWSLGFQETLPQPQNKNQQEAIPIRWSSTPCLTLIQKPDPHQSPEEVLALNAAAIIANIKLQRQLSQKKTLPCNSKQESSTSPKGNTGIITPQM